jgi:hypothetical protein
MRVKRLKKNRSTAARKLILEEDRVLHGPYSQWRREEER